MNLRLLALVLVSLPAIAHAPKTDLRKAFDGAALEQCVPASVTVRVSLVVHPDGGWAIALEPGLEEVRACLELAVKTALAPLKLAPREAVVLSRKVTAPVAKVEVKALPDDLPPHDGKEGAICSWGSWRGAAFLQARTPAECRAGLMCCAAGGAAGSDSTCIKAGRGCPAYP